MRSHYLIILLLTITLASPLYSNAQNVEDPLRKPEVWDKLLNAPGVNAFWASYMGKPFAAMTVQEKDQIEEWRKAIQTGHADSSHVVLHPENLSATDDRFWDDDGTLVEAEKRRTQHLATAQRQYLAQLEVMMLEEPEFLLELKNNIKANFFIIEDSFQQEFGDLGVDYVTYSSKYPNGNYSQDLWVKEKADELQQLKREEFEKMKAQLTSE